MTATGGWAYPTKKLRSSLLNLYLPVVFHWVCVLLLCRALLFTGFGYLIRIRLPGRILLGRAGFKRVDRSIIADRFGLFLAQGFGMD